MHGTSHIHLHSPGKVSWPPLSKEEQQYILGIRGPCLQDGRQDTCAGGYGQRASWKGVKRGILLHLLTEMIYRHCISIG